MMKRALFFVASTLICCGCRGGGLYVDYHEHRHHRPARKAYVHRSHVHEVPVCAQDRGDCYWDGDTVIVLKGHRHGPGCGHMWDGSNWVAVSKAPARNRVVHPDRTVGGPRAHPPRHRGSNARDAAHTQSGHVYDRRVGKWIAIDPHHVHGPNCGHVYRDGRWCVR